MQLSDHVPPPTQPAGAFLAHETECRKVFLPLLEDLLDKAEQAGWDRRTVASTLMFLSAKQVSAAGSRDS